MIFPACIKLPASSHYKGMYPHGSPILWYIQETHQLNHDRPDLRQPGMGVSHQPPMLLLS